MPSTKSLSILDMAFFVLETHTRMSNIGPLAILKPPAGARSAKGYADRLMKQMKAQPPGPPFNYRYRGPGLQGLPCLERVDEVDLDAHCRRISLGGQASDAELFERVCRLHERRLDRSRPPWEFYIIDGLQGGRIALYAKVHHGMIDGRTFVQLCTRWFTPDPADKSVRAIWQAVPARRSSAARDTALTSATRLARRAVETGLSMASLYGALLRQAIVAAGLAEGMGLPFLGTPKALNARASVKRSFAYCTLPLGRMKALGRAQEASVNDVLLTVLDMALQRFLAGKGHSAEAQPLVVDMPVALPAAEGSSGNRIAVLQFPLGATQAAPLERLQAIVQQTATVKRHVRQSGADAMVAYTAAVHGVPAILELLNIERGPMLANVMISNPFGLPEKRYLAGAELEMALPVSLLAPGQALNVTAATYADSLQLAFLGFAAGLPDIQQLADYTADAFEQLYRAGTPRRASRIAKNHQETL